MQGFSRFSPVPVRSGSPLNRSRVIPNGMTAGVRLSSRFLNLFSTLTVTFCLTIFLLLLQRSENPYIEPTVTSIRLSITNAMAPVIRLTERPLQAIQSISTALVSQQTLLDEKLNLQMQNQYLQRQQQQLQQLIVENNHLRKALSLGSSQEMFHSAAKVTGHSYNGACGHLIISSEVSEKIEKNSPVLSVEGYLVGRVISNSTTDARVMPVVNINSRIPVQMENTREHAILIGDQALGLKLSHLEKSSPVTVGTKLITSGVGGVFPAGIPVAVVTEVNGDSIKAIPYADIKRLEYVVVLQ